MVKIEPLCCDLIPQRRLVVGPTLANNYRKIHYSAIFIKKKQCRSFQIGQYEIGAIDITPRPYNVIDAAGTPHPRRFAIGAPYGRQDDFTIFRRSIAVSK
jgi:hypothetical protein